MKLVHWNDGCRVVNFKRKTLAIYIQICKVQKEDSMMNNFFFISCHKLSF